MLPYPVYANPVSGPLNMPRALPGCRCPPDLGPKSYLATGREVEKNDGTDSVTKIHMDMADAVNVLVHAQSKSPDDSKYGTHCCLDRLRVTVMQSLRRRLDNSRSEGRCHHHYVSWRPRRDLRER